MLKYGELISS